MRCLAWLMEQRLSNYLRTHRKKSNLTQQEVAYLAGLDSGQMVSRYELQSRTPSLRTALALQIIFDRAPHELFPGVYYEVEKVTRRRIRLLSQKIDTQPSSLVERRKKEILLQSLERVNHECNGV